MQMGASAASNCGFGFRWRGWSSVRIGQKTERRDRDPFHLLKCLFGRGKCPFQTLKGPFGRGKCPFRTLKGPFGGGKCPFRTLKESFHLLKCPFRTLKGRWLFLANLKAGNAFELTEQAENTGFRPEMGFGGGFWVAGMVGRLQGL